MTHTARRVDRLRAHVLPPEDLSTPDRDRMYAIFTTYYEHVSRPRFDADLAEKDAVIVMRTRRQQAIQGFSTLRHLDLDVDGRRVFGLFSGDTVMERPYWGQRALHRAFLRYFVWQQLKRPWTPCYWFLISKGYKTYLLMTNNMPIHYPRYERDMPDDQRRIRDAFATRLFPLQFDARSGLITFPGLSCRLKANVAPITAAMCQANPRIAFFARLNPGWQDGTELACLARLTWSTLACSVRKAWQRRLWQHRPRSRPAAVAEGLPSRPTLLRRWR